MTRTERNQNPAALLKDRHSRSGLTNQSELLRKNGAGAHNWGSFKQEGELEAAADLDVRAEPMDDDNDDMFDMEDADARNLSRGKIARPQAPKSGEDEMDGFDLPKREVIATSPTDSTSSIESGGKGRRMSNVTDEERDRARVYRESYKHNAPVDLAHIAKTSYGIAQSPPNGNSFATSPTKGLHMK